MAPMDITVGQLIDQIDRDLPDADPVAKVGEARARAKILGDMGDALVDHFVQAARRAGASWSQIGDAMGVSKQAAQQAAQQRATGSGGRFARFTLRARKVVENAQHLAGAESHAAVEPEHVLVALLGATDALAAKIIEARGADPAALAEQVRATLPPRGTAGPIEHVPFSGASKQLLEDTASSALDLLNNYIGTEHILLGLLRSPDRSGARILVAAGIDHASARDMVAAALTGIQHEPGGPTA